MDLKKEPNAAKEDWCQMIYGLNDPTGYIDFLRKTNYKPL